MPMQRMHMKQLLADQEAHHPRLFANLLTAMKPLMALQGAEAETGADES
jgi:tRNA 2-thiocytidine biosynthesis protein TtcA